MSKLKQVTQQLKPRKTDLLTQCQTRKQVAISLDISDSTLYRWDAQATYLVQDYRLDRMGSRLPLTDYQVWVLSQIKQLYYPYGKTRHGKTINGDTIPMARKMVVSHIKNHPETLTFTAYLRNQKEQNNAA